MPTTAPYGSWKSPVSASLLARGAVSLGAVFDAGGELLWLEGRPAEGGRTVACRRGPGGAPEDLVPDGWSVRTRVHEYGGGSLTTHGDSFFCSNLADQRLYRFDPGAEPRPLTPEPPAPGALRYADGRVTPDGAWLVCVRESHGEGEARNELVALPTDGSAPPAVLAGGRDFYSSPRPSPDGRFLAWLEWDHPNMPWDGCELRVAPLGASELAGPPSPVAGGPGESVFQPEWAPDGALWFAGDRSGWWNLYREAGAGAEAVAPVDAEVAVPQWLFGMATYAFLPDGRVVAHACRGPDEWLALIEPGTGACARIDLPYQAFAPFLATVGGRVAVVAGGPAATTALLLLDPDSGAFDVVRRSTDEALDPGYLSVPRRLTFPSARGRTAHALYYPPANRDFQGPPGECPPLLVISHGGPTGQAVAVLNPEVQLFTSRGFGVVDVDYLGSSGYGRDYRQGLAGLWGVADVEDCTAAARHLVASGDADPERLIIRGGSAGGYTTLCALTFHDTFKAGASYFGVADPAALARSTHKFESRYLEGLIGPLPEAEARFRERSPIHFTERLSCPVILLQGLEDPVVPPAQAEAMASALAARGIPYAYLAFEGEQHGFRQADHIQRAAEAELYFYSRIFGFDLADEVEPVKIHGL